MRTFDPADQLKPGEIFTENGNEGQDNGEQRVTYVVLGVRDGLTHVAELDGECRNDRVVFPQDLPAPGSVSRWRFNAGIDLNRTDEFLRTTLGQLRTALPFLGVAEELGGSTYKGGILDETIGGTPTYVTHVRFDDKVGPFDAARYSLHPNGKVHPAMIHFDLEKLGVLPPEMILKRDESGRPTMFSSRVNDLTLDDDGVARIEATAKAMGVLMYADQYLGAPIFNQGQQYRGVQSITGYIPNGENPPRPRLYTDLTAAHAAVMAIHDPK